jgi:hypothetical protein
MSKTASVGCTPFAAPLVIAGQKRAKAELAATATSIQFSIKKFTKNP